MMKVNRGIDKVVIEALSEGDPTSWTEKELVI